MRNKINYILLVFKFILSSLIIITNIFIKITIQINIALVNVTAYKMKCFTLKYSRYLLPSSLFTVKKYHKIHINKPDLRTFSLANILITVLNFNLRKIYLSIYIIASHERWLSFIEILNLLFIIFIYENDHSPLQLDTIFNMMSTL